MKCATCGGLMGFDEDARGWKCVNSHYVFLPEPEPVKLRPPAERREKAKREHTPWAQVKAELQAQAPGLVDVDGAAAILCMTTGTVKQMKQRGELGCVEMFYGKRKRLYFDPAEVEAVRDRRKLGNGREMK